MNAAAAIVRTYWLESKLEFLKNLRLPVFSLSTLLFPVMFYLMFGLAFGGGPIGSVPRPLYFAVAYSAFGVVGACLFGFGANVATERGQGWMLLRRAFPAPPFAYFVAKMFMATAFSLAIIVILLVLAVLAGGASLGFADLARVVPLLLAGTLPFSAMGLALGYLCGPNSAPAVINLVYLPRTQLPVRSHRQARRRQPHRSGTARAGEGVALGGCAVAARPTRTYLPGRGPRASDA